MYIDTHAHLTDELYGGAREIVRQMKVDGLDKIITVGYDEQSSRACVELARENAAIFAAAGVHPSDSGGYNSGTEEAICRLCGEKKVVAVGEIGLDYHYDDTDRDVQREVFLRQLKLASAVGLPVVLHIRDAYGEALEMLENNVSLLTHGGVLHCYSGSAEMLDRFLPLGLYVSFSGSVTFKNNRKADECIGRVPFDRILTETDCPYLAPVPHRGQPNRPAYVRFVAEKIASVYGMDIAELCQRVSDNAEKLFKFSERQ